MKFKSLNIPDVFEISPNIIKDSRGYFFELFRVSEFKKKIGNFSFVQENESYSKKHTLRGLHLQLFTKQGKLIRVLEGEIFDVGVDLRKKSKFYGKFVTLYLNSKNKNLLWLPPGFAHGFFVTSEYAKIEYKCTNYYSPSDEIVIDWKDSDLNIKWPLNNIKNKKIYLSQKDKKSISFNDFTSTYS